jgi:hypothetical protein
LAEEAEERYQVLAVLKFEFNTFNYPFGVGPREDARTSELRAGAGVNSCLMYSDF